jgi:hypothetical protein
VIAVIRTVCLVLAAWLLLAFAITVAQALLK